MEDGKQIENEKLKMKKSQFSIGHYPLMKDSGVEWIGEIPEGWEVKKIKYISKLQGGFAFKSDSFTETGIPIIRIGDIKPIIDFDGCKNISEQLVVPSEFILQKNDTLIALSGATTGKTTFVESEPKHSYINQRVAKVGFDNKLLFFNISGDFVHKLILLTADGSAQENISNSQIENIDIAIPASKPEQTAIANYLDCKTAEIDQLIAQKERLLYLYEEEKTAIINQAVTQGINPNVKLKDSGIDWLGEIPDGWEVKKLKVLIRQLESGVSVNATDFPASKEAYGILKTSCVYNYVFDPSGNKEIWQSELVRARVNPRKGEIIISRMNPTANLFSPSSSC